MVDSIHQAAEVPSTLGSKEVDSEKIEAIHCQLSRQSGFEVANDAELKDKEAMEFLHDVLRHDTSHAQKKVTTYQLPTAVTSQVAKVQAWLRSRTVTAEDNTTATNRSTPAAEQTSEAGTENDISNPHNEVDRGTNQDMLRIDWNYCGITPSRGDSEHYQRDGLDRLSNGPRKVPEGFGRKKDDDGGEQRRDKDGGDAGDPGSTGDGDGGENGDKGDGRRERVAGRKFQFDSTRYIRTLGAFSQPSSDLSKADADIIRNIRVEKKVTVWDRLAAIEDTACAVLPVPEGEAQLAWTDKQHMKALYKYKEQQNELLGNNPELAEFRQNFLERQRKWETANSPSWGSTVCAYSSCSHSVCLKKRRAERYMFWEDGQKLLRLPHKVPPELAPLQMGGKWRKMDLPAMLRLIAYMRLCPRTNTRWGSYSQKPSRRA